MKLPVQIYKVGDIVHVDFDYGDDDGGSKYRPSVVVIKSTYDGKCVLLKITSADVDGSLDHKIKDMKYTGLDKESVVRCNHYIVVENNRLLEKIGSLSDRDIKVVENKFFKAQMLGTLYYGGYKSKEKKKQ